MKVPILSGIYASEDAEFHTSYPRNLVPVAKSTGIDEGYLAPADGITMQGTGPGVVRGGINWNGKLYRVMGSNLVQIEADGTVSMLGDVGGGATPVTIDYSFDRLAITSSGGLFYWDGTTLSQVTDPDLGTALAVIFIGGYFMTTDGSYLVVTELNDPLSVSTLKYGSSESDPDPIMRPIKLREEAYAVNRYTIEAFQNVGGDFFPFARIPGATVLRGAIGTFMCCEFLDTIAFVGSGRNEAPSVWLMQSGSSTRLSTREIDLELAALGEDVLSQCVLERRVDKGQQRLMIHLPTKCWVYDAAASAAFGEPAWYSHDSGLDAAATYRARYLVWCYDRWNVGDPTSSQFGYLTTDTMEQDGQQVGWEFGTVMLWNGADMAAGGIIQNIELVCLPGRVPLGVDPVIWTSYSLDGQTWSREQSKSAGKQGERGKRLCWRGQGKFRNYRIQRFRGTSDARLSIARLELDVEALRG